MTDVVLSKLEHGVRTVRLNRPAVLNAMNAELVESLAEILEHANIDADTRVVVLTGNGKAFCAGADLKERRDGITEHIARENIERIQRVTRAMVLGRKIIIGAINGWAVGGGFEWALGCDFSIWARSAKAFFPEAAWGLFVTGAATAILPALVGPQKAKEMMLLGAHYNAEQLATLGVAWKVVNDDCLMNESYALARRLASLPERSLETMKAVINVTTYSDVETAIQLETQASIHASTDPETMRRIRGFKS